MAISQAIHPFLFAIFRILSLFAHNIGEVDFAIDLITRDNWNYTTGIAHYFSDTAVSFL